MALVYLSFGSNLGDRRLNIEKAAALICEKGIIPEVFSPLYETEPLHNPDQPVFYNSCVSAHTALTPRECLKAMKDAEKELGRAADAPRYSPRIIDIDLLYYDNIIIKSGDIIIPHPQIMGRRFVLAPLSDIAPDFKDPESGMTVKQALNACAAAGYAKKLESR